MGEIFTLLFVQPITNVLVGVYQLLLVLHAPSPLGFAIILLTVIVRLVLFPLMAAQLRSAKKMQNVTPHLSRLKEQHKGNPQKLQSETMLLYKEHGINPAAGCIPLIIQLPVIWGLYSVLQHVVKQTSVQEINKLLYTDALKLHTIWDSHFFGIPLGKTPGELIGVVGVGILIIPILTGVSQFIQSKMMLPPPSTQPTTKKKGGATDFATAFQTQSLYIFPIMIAFFSYSFPAGLSFYWITFTFFGIIQQYLMQRGQEATVATPIMIEKTKKPAVKKRNK